MLIVALVFIVLLALGMPIAFTIGIAGLSYVLVTPDLSLINAALKMSAATQSFNFLAVPFFIIAGNMMVAAGITDRLIDFSKKLTGHMVGGLAQVSVILSALMGGISGSAVADASMEARALGPSMLKSGYSKGFTCGILSFGGLITATIPPSTGLILFGYVCEVSIGKLFIAGVIPGILMTIVLMVTTNLVSKKRGYKPMTDKRASGKEIWQSFKASIWALIFPLILIVGIRGGLFTAAEAGAFAVVYAVFVGVFIYKEMDWKKFVEVMKHSVTDNGTIMMIVTAAGILGFVFTYSGIPHQVGRFLISITSSKYILLTIVIVVMFFMGMIMDSAVNCLIFAPIFMPVLKQVGVDPLHFGVLFMTVVTMGCMTPPVGTAMTASCSILDCTIGEYTKESLPFLAAILFEIIILMLVPQLSTFLPNLIY